MNRRNLLGGLAGILAAGFAPAAVGSGILIPVKRIAVPTHIGVSLFADYTVTIDCNGYISGFGLRPRLEHP